MRDVLIHWYSGVDYEIVWNVIEEKLPPLRATAERLLEGLEVTDHVILRMPYRPRVPWFPVGLCSRPGYTRMPGGTNTASGFASRCLAIA